MARQAIGSCIEGAGSIVSGVSDPNITESVVDGTGTVQNFGPSGMIGHSQQDVVGPCLENVVTLRMRGSLEDCEKIGSQVWNRTCIKPAKDISK